MPGSTQSLNLPPIQLHYSVRQGQTCRSVRDQNRRSWCATCFYFLPGNPFRLRVKHGRGFIHDQDGRFIKQSTGQGNALALSAGKPDPLVANEGGIAFGQRFDEFLSTGRHRGLFHFCFGRVGISIADILSNGSIQQQGVLRHEANLPSQGDQVYAVDIVSVDQNSPLLWFHEAHEEVSERGLTDSIQPGNGNGLAGFDDQVQVKKEWMAAGIGKADVFEFNLALLDDQGRTAAGQRFGADCKEIQQALGRTASQHDLPVDTGQAGNRLRQQHGVEQQAD